MFLYGQFLSVHWAKEVGRCYFALDLFSQRDAFWPEGNEPCENTAIGIIIINKTSVPYHTRVIR